MRCKAAECDRLAAALAECQRERDAAIAEAAGYRDLLAQIRDFVRLKLAEIEAG